MTSPSDHAETRAILAGRAANATALAPVLWASTTFVTETVAEGRKMATSVGATSRRSCTATFFSASGLGSAMPRLSMTMPMTRFLMTFSSPKMGIVLL